MDHTPLLPELPPVEGKDIFISYSHNDSEKIYPIVDGLRRQGFQCWIDQNPECLRHGENYFAAIADAIDHCQLFIAFLSRSYIQKEFCKREYNYKAEKSMPLMLVIQFDDMTVAEMGKYKYMRTFVPSGENLLGYNEPLGELSPEEACSQIAQTCQLQLLKKGKKLTEEVIASAAMFNAMQNDLNRSFGEHKRHLLGGQVQENMLTALERVSDARRKSDAEDAEDVEDAPEPESDPAQGGDSAAPLLLDNEEDLFGDDFEDDDCEDDDCEDETPSPECSTETAPEPKPQAVETKLVASLKEFLLSSSEKHVFLVNDGGFGKTTTMLRTCEQLLEEQHHAIYVPLKNVSRDVTLEDYLRANLCQGENPRMGLFDRLMQYSARPTFLFLDGLNELHKELLPAFIKNLCTIFLPSHRAVRLIVSSRHDNRKDPELAAYPALKEAELLRLLPLSEDCIHRQLEQQGIESPTDPQLLELLKTPLLLSLYCDTESQRKHYAAAATTGLTFHSLPRSPGALLHNYFQTQLCRVAHDNRELSSHLVLLELLLPMLAIRMLREDTFVAPWELLQACMEQLDYGRIPPYLDWFDTDRISPITHTSRSLTPKQLGELASTAIRNLSFLSAEHDGYSFSNQIFRDYFAAVFLRFEIVSLTKDPLRREALKLHLEQQAYPEDVLSLAADLLEEQKYRPVLEEQTALSANKKKTRKTKQWVKPQGSAVEAMLEQYRGREGAEAQTAVYNLLHILRLGRKGALFLCDFSRFDLRRCKLTGFVFSNHYDKKFFSSSFDGAWLEPGCFMGIGHSFLITAICQDQSGRICTGARDGTVILWQPDRKAPLRTIAAGNEPIRQLLPAPGRLFILTAHTLSQLDTETWELTVLTQTNRYYFGVRLNSSREPELCCDTDPLCWHSLPGSAERTDITRRRGLPPTGCIAVHPDKTTLLCGDLYGTLRKYRWNAAADCWQDSGEALSLRELTDGRRITSLVFDPTGESLFATYGCCVFHLSTASLSVLNQYSFPYSANAVCCLEDGQLAVANGIRVSILQPDFTADGELPGCHRPPIADVKEKDGKIYLLARNGELKELTDDLHVRTVRRLNPAPYTFEFAHTLSEKRNNCIVLLHEQGEQQSCVFYVPQQDRYFQPGIIRCEIEDDREDMSDKSYEFFRNKSQLTCLNRKAGKVFVWRNYPNICVYGCSFTGVKTDAASYAALQEIITLNGGTVDAQL